MLEYRLYPLDWSGRICGPPNDLVCPDDEAAIEKARLLIDGHDVELWQRDRLVIRLTRRQRSETAPTGPQNPTPA